MVNIFVFLEKNTKRQTSARSETGIQTFVTRKMLGILFSGDLYYTADCYTEVPTVVV